MSKAKGKPKKRGRPRGQHETAVLTIHLPPELLDRLDAVSRQQSRTRSAQARLAVLEQVERLEAQRKEQP